MNRNHKLNRTRLRRTVAAVLIAAGLIAVVGVVLVAPCLSFDETGAHVIDHYGVLSDDQLETIPEDKPKTEKPKDDPEKKPEPEHKAYTRAVMLTADTVAEKQDALLQAAEQGTIDTVIVNIKDGEGNLNLSVSTDEMESPEYLVSSGADALQRAIGTLKGAGVHVIGRIYCFHDALATKRNSDLAIQYELGGTWLDYDNSRWLDPTNPAAVSYLADIARSAVQAGCDEIVLADMTFPPRGHLDRATFDTAPEEQASVLAQDVQDIQKAVGDVPVSLTADTFAGLIELSVNGEKDGIPVGDVGTLLKTAHRLFVPVDSGSVEDLKQELYQLAKKTDVVAVFLSGETWKAHDGDAVLNGMFDGDAALDIILEK